MQVLDRCSGQELADMFAASIAWLEQHVVEINALNVFPVPDGDTGTNMLLTMRGAVAETACSPKESASAVARAIAHGALMGARGNSGVILSQILRGLALRLDGKEYLDGGNLVAGLAEGTSLAYKAVSRPVEGTILTVVREASAAAEEASSTSKGLLNIMEVIVKAARESLARTPLLLPVLREVGVVDAGGLGLCVIFEGALHFLKGTTDEGYQAPEPISVPQAKIPTPEPYHGYCTEFMIEGENLSLDRIRGKMETMGESILVVGDEGNARIHLHTPDPEAALNYAASLGKLHQVKVQNMDDQHEDLFARQQPVPVATVAVVSGEGLCEVFRSLGVTAIVPGGETMNPSVDELLQTITTVPSDKVILLPNNPNIVLAAEQARKLAAKQVEVIPTQSVPQGIAALLAYNYEADFEANVKTMETAKATVRTIEATKAVRKARFGGLVMAKGQSICFLDGELVAVGDSTPQVVSEVLDQIDLDGSDIITIFYGSDTSGTEAEQLAAALRQKYHTLEVEVLYGGQPHYNYIVSVG